MLYPLPELKRIGKIQRSNTHIDKLDFTRVTEGWEGGKREENEDLNDKGKNHTRRFLRYSNSHFLMHLLEKLHKFSPWTFSIETVA